MSCLFRAKLKLIQRKNFDVVIPLKRWLYAGRGVFNTKHELLFFLQLFYNTLQRPYNIVHVVFNSFISKMNKVDS